MGKKKRRKRPEEISRKEILLFIREKLGKGSTYCDKRKDHRRYKYCNISSGNNRMVKSLNLIDIQSELLEGLRNKFDTFPYTFPVIESEGYDDGAKISIERYGSDTLVIRIPNSCKP
jgi:hypothetical protein